MTTFIAPSTDEERDRYPLHEEDNVSETEAHEQAVRYLRGAIAAASAEWRVSGNIGIYWEPGNYVTYAAPDLIVVREPRATPARRNYILWKDPPIAFIAEVGSRTTEHLEETSRLDTYQNIVRVPEYLYVDLEKQAMRLRRLGPRGYEMVEQEPGGRLRSQELGLEFGFDGEGEPRVYYPDGTQILTHEEAVAAAAEEARARADAERRVGDAERRAFEEADERRVAQTLAAREMRQRQAAEARIAEATARAAEAEARVAEEAARREELEGRLAELEAQPRKQEPGDVE